MNLDRSELSRRYEEAKDQVWRKAKEEEAKLGVEIVFEARGLGESCAIFKKRSFQDYRDMAARLLAEYPPELAFYIARQITSEFASAIGYIPTPHIMKAVEHIEGLDPAHRSSERTTRAAQTLVAGLCSMTIDDARETFSTLEDLQMRDLVRGKLLFMDNDMAQYITG